MGPLKLDIRVGAHFDAAHPPPISALFVVYFDIRAGYVFELINLLKKIIKAMLTVIVTL